MKFTIQPFAMLIALLLAGAVYAQSDAQKEMIRGHVHTSARQIGQLATDITDYEITSFHTSIQSGITHYYLQQRHQGIPVHNAHIGLHVNAENELLILHNQFLKSIASRINTTKPMLDAATAISGAAQAMKYDMSELPRLKETKSAALSKGKIFTGGSISKNDIPVGLVYQQTADGNLRLCWDMSIAEMQNHDSWSMRIDATTGEILDKVNRTLYCSFGEVDCTDDLHDHTHITTGQKGKYADIQQQQKSFSSNVPNSYHVFPAPVESPNHGIRQLVVNPADAVASPFGWHDIDGVTGAEYTVTRGNNVSAQEDINGDNGTGFSPDGTASLDFDFGLNLAQSSASSPNLESAITNLFYWNNLMHDVWYHYGFDEASGNFQVNNYGRGGLSRDGMIADAHDGAGANNAFFLPDVDGISGRIQMYIWSETVTQVNSPAGITGNYHNTIAQFGAQNFNVTGNLVVVDDGTAAPTEGCNPPVNGAAINGNIAFIDKGGCQFGTKALHAQNAGAIAIIVCNDVSGTTTSMPSDSDSGNVTIPAVMMYQSDCAAIRTQLPGVNVTLSSNPLAFASDFDNGMIAHEYGHGISTRLVGGAGTISCLSNEEQMGEGWSDWFALMMTIEPGDTRNDKRPIGTYVLGQTPTGNGIRNYPYTCDMSINPHTYADISTEIAPHGVGSVWSVMLWEMTWDLIDLYGLDSDLHYGTGGNNIAMALVTEGMKLLPCNPGFVDGRDAIILADRILYDGANECLIRQAFARRGLGDNASQGNTNSTGDGTEDFTTNCNLPCTGGVNLSIRFDNTPQQTSWDITDADGNVVVSAYNQYTNETPNATLDVPDLACLPDGCYTLNFYDTGNNGLCPFQSSASSLGTFVTPGTLVPVGSVVATLGAVVSPAICGNYTLTDANGTTLVSGGGNFGVQQNQQFCLSGGVAPLVREDGNIYSRLSSKTITDMTILPNIVNNEVTISYQLENAANAQLQIIDINGQVLEQHIQGEQGLQEVRFDVSELSAGFYFVRLIAGQSVLLRKFVKQ